MEQYQHQLSTQVQMSRPQSVVIQDAQGRFYQVTPIGPAPIASTQHHYQQQRIARQRQSSQRNQTANQVGLLILGIGGVFTLGIFFFIFAGLFASAMRPAPAPAPQINENCIINCGV